MAYGNGTVAVAESPAPAVSAWQELSEQAIVLMDELDNAHAHFVIAMKATYDAKVAADKAEQDYNDFLAEKKVELMFGDEFRSNKDAQKNAETRSAWMDWALLNERKHGELGVLFDEWQEAKRAFEAAKVNEEAARRMVHAIQYKIDLTSSRIRGVQA